MIRETTFVLSAATVCLFFPRANLAADTESETPAPEIRESDFCRSLEYAGVAVNEPGYHCWGTSPIMDDEGKIHLFVARWPVPSETFRRGFDKAWRHDSEIAHYVGDGPEGPFTFADVALKGTGGDTWDRYAAHNPLIKKVDGEYVLLYIGNSVGITKGKGNHPRAQRIGMAVSDSLNGPWKKVGKDGKILGPSDERGHWTYQAGNGVNNPAFVKAPNGKYYLYFKSHGARMGVAIADKIEGSYVHQPNPLSSNERRVEDGYAFISGGKFYLLTTDNHGVNVRGGGLLWKSDDGITFDATPEIGYQSPKTVLPEVERKNVRLYYGSGTFQRPQVLVQDGRPTHLYVASGTNITGGDGSLSYVLRCNYEKLETQRSQKPVKSEEAVQTLAKPKIVKMGTIDLDVVEGHNFVWQGRLLREQWCKNHYKGERGLPGSQIAIRDVQTGKLLASLAQDHAFGTVYVEDDTAYVVATYDKPGPKRRKQVNLFASKDLKNWQQWNVIDDPQFNICNTSLIKVGDEYVLMFEINRPNVNSWTARFAKSRDLKNWEILPEEYIHGRNKMAAPHCLKYHDGYFYNFHVVRHRGYSTFVSRSSDLKHWEDSPLNPVLMADDEDRKLAPGVEFTDEQKQRIATARNINNSDIDILEHEGKCLISYSWGNQHGTEHLATAEYNGHLASFLEGWFPGTSE